MKNTQPQQRCEIGMVGLGVMGRNLALNMADHGFSVAGFMRADQVEAAWQWLMPVLEVWAQAPPSDFPNYAAGTWGPEETQGLLACGHSWPPPTELVGPRKKNGRNS
jgi:hypothetical protein